MKYSLFSFLLLFCFESAGQQMTSLGFDTFERKISIDLNVNAEATTQSISNRIIFPLLFGGYVEKETMQKEANRQGQLTKLGAYIDPELSISLFDVRIFKKKPWGLRFNAGLLMTGAARVSGGLIGMAMVGNEPFIGNSIPLSNQVYEYFNAHKIGFGLVDAKSKSSVSLNAYGIQSYAKGTVVDGSMIFNAMGDLSLEMEGLAQNAYSNAYYVGAGVGIDASFNLNVGKVGKETYFNFSIKNLGVGFLNNPLNRYEVDSTWNYSGFTFNQLNELGEKFDDIDKTIEELGVNRTQGSKVVLMPMQIHIGKLINESLTKRWQFSYGVRVYVQNAAIPLLYGGTHFRANNWLRIGAGLNYGGYGGLRGNIYIQGIWDKFVAGVHINNVLGLTNYGRGLSANISIGYRINK